MSDKTEWTDATWNPSIGCRRVSEGCRNCYAMSQAARIVAMERGNGRRSSYEDVVQVNPYGDPIPRWNGRAVFLPERLDQPLRWTKPRRVFVNSMSDLFHEDLTFEQIAAVFGVMAAASRHTFQVLTKRPGRALEFFDWLAAHGWGCPNGMMSGASDPDRTAVAYARDHIDRNIDIVAPHTWPLPNVWLGVSAEDQATANERIPLLLQCPAAVRFVSAEPLLGPIDLCPWSDEHGGDPWLFRHPIETGEGYVERHIGEHRCIDCANRIDWVIVGGESGPGARPCDVAWIRSIVEQCSDVGVACFVKQASGPRSGMQGDIPDDIWIQEFPNAS